MQRASWNPGAARWTVVEVGAVSFALYLAWLAAFERVVEPRVRGLWGTIVGSEIVWVPAGAVRIWGSTQAVVRSREAAIALVGGLFVLASAALPVLALHFVALALEAEGVQIRGSTYLMSVPMMAIFASRMFARRGGSPASQR